QCQAARNVLFRALAWRVFVKNL
ncbi:hypothetical protein, partial [Kingella kingae]